MDRVFESGAVVLAPPVPSSPSAGYPTGGNPVGGVPATKPGAHWFHMITEEILGVIVAGGLTPAAATLTQLLQALPAALASRPEMARSLVTNGYQKLPGGFILQWGTNTGNNPAATLSFPLAFPTACLGIVGCLSGGGSGSNVQSLSATSISATQFQLLTMDSSGGTFSKSGRWLAVGH